MFVKNKIFFSSIEVSQQNSQRFKTASQLHVRLSSGNARDDNKEKYFNIEIKIQNGKKQVFNEMSNMKMTHTITEWALVAQTYIQINRRIISWWIPASGNQPITVVAFATISCTNIISLILYLYILYPSWRLHFWLPDSKPEVNFAHLTSICLGNWYGLFLFSQVW